MCMGCFTTLTCLNLCQDVHYFAINDIMIAATTCNSHLTVLYLGQPT